MTRYRVAVAETYADGVTDQPWSVARRVVAAEGAACLRPVEVKANGHRRLIPCGQRLPADRQCTACRTEIDIVNVRKGRSCT